MKYKQGDRVKIKSFDWYNENKDKYGCIYAGNGFCFWKNMARNCGEIMKIAIVKVDPEDSNKGYYFMENSEERWTDDMFEGLVEEETKPNVIEEAKTYWDSIKDAWICPDGYIFKDENGNVINATKIVLEKKKKEYPKTYEECCNVMNKGVCFGINGIYGDELNIYNTFIKLKRCRDAYWKIAGEEMGLGKPWEPQECVIYYYMPNTIHYIRLMFPFPTTEMRDAFKENFKELIEQCEELL